MINNELKEKLTDAVALLNVPGIGRGRYRRLVEKFGSPGAVFSAPVEELEAVDGFSSALVNEIKSQYDADKARRIASRIVQLGWEVLFFGEPGYPRLLLTIPEPPPLLFRLGEPEEEEEKCIAIVGTRHPTERGRQFAYQLAYSLAETGITVVSGLAEGIDSAAHKGALQAEGRTVAVLGNSLDIVYPPANRSLAEQIKQRGALYSEYFPETKPNPAHFPERNRIISGMAVGVVVVEAGKKSGALITASYALQQGRELFAVPGAPSAPLSVGTNDLIKKGARLLTSIEDIFEELPRLKGEIRATRFTRLPDLTEKEKEIVTLLSHEAVHIDQLSRTLELSMAELTEYLLALELKGVVQEISGKRFVLADSGI